MLLRECYCIYKATTVAESIGRSLQAAAFDLEKKLAADHLKHDLEKRHTREELVERTSYNALYHIIGKLISQQATSSQSPAPLQLSSASKGSLPRTCVETA